jgi:hypothetical protein
MGSLGSSNPGGLGLGGDFCAPWSPKSTREPESTQENVPITRSAIAMVPVVLMVLMVRRKG